MSSTRMLLEISGTDRESYLQGLVTNDIADLEGRLVYAALLTPQGKYLADFFLTARNKSILLDVAAPLGPGLAQRLNMYRLRADVAISESPLSVSRGTGTPPAPGALPDPRHPALGWRLYGKTPFPADNTDWDTLRVAHCIPESGIELTPESYILEAGFERLNGVDFRKGCFVGQEIVARMKHKTELRKGLAQVQLDGDATPGSEITANGRPVGTLHTRAGDRAIAYLRFDRAKGDMQVGNTKIRLVQG